MTESAPKTRTDVPRINRRHLLKGLAATGVATTAGCLGDDDDDPDPADDDDDPADDDTPADDDDDDPDPDIEYEEGGRFEMLIERPGMDHVDYVMSNLADDSIIFNAVYDSLATTDVDGETINWMAEEYDVVDWNDVGVDDYEPYMRELEIEEYDEGVPIFEEVAWPNRILIWHPDERAAALAGELEEGDTVRALTREEAPDAVEDGVYGTHVHARLHEGIQFHNGEELTAGDYVGSYDRYVDSILDGQIADSFMHAEATNGDDGYEIDLYTQLPDGAALLELSLGAVFPEEQHDVPPGELSPEDWIGTGPYQIAEYAEGDHVTLERFDEYWMQDVGLDAKAWWDGPDEFPEAPVIGEINFQMVPEEGTRVAALQQGSADLAYELPAAERDAFDDDDDFTVDAKPTTGYKFFQLPVEETEEGGAFAHKEVRQAIANLIPRQQIVDAVDGGWGAPGELPFPEPASFIGTASSYDELLEEDWIWPAEPDHDTAEQLIEDSPLEPPIEIVVETNADDETRQDKVAWIVDELNQSGLFEAVQEEPADLLDWVGTSLLLEGSRFDYAERNAGAILGLAGGFDPHGYAETLYDPDNWNICCNFFFPEGTFDWIDDMRLARFSTEAAESLDNRREMYDEIWPQLVEESANIIVDYSLETAVAGPDVRGFEIYPDRRFHVSWSFWAPHDEQLMWLDR